MQNNFNELLKLIEDKKRCLTEKINTDEIELIKAKLDIDTDGTKRINDFSIEEYMFNKWINIRFDSKEWFNSNPNINIDENIRVKQKGDYYISYKEKNIVFNNLPSLCDIDISSNYEYKFKMSGKLDNLIVKLFIISYDTHKKLDVYSANINDEICIKFNRDATKIRLAIKCSGVGSFEVKDIEISRKKNIGLLDINNYRKLGYDRPKSLNKLKVAAICDEFTYECLKDEVELITFTTESWRAKLEINKPHMLFIESAWSGKNNSWSRKVASSTGAGLEYIQELIAWCNEREIPTVFWNKEDPVHYKAFIKTAKLCDYIYTTDKNMVSSYKKDTGNDNVHVMQFFAQAKVHNPIKITMERENKACFAGSYYAEKYIERQKDMLDILNIVKEYGLVIYDRHYDDNNPQFEFPEKYRKYILGKLQPWEVVKAYKDYKFMINVNSVIDSPTMFSRRIFEGLACGTPIISTYSKGIKETFGNIVIMGDSINEIKDKFNSINENEFLYDKTSIEGIRKVYENHMISNRVEKICKDIGIEISKRERIVGVITTIENRRELEKFKAFVNSQTFKNFIPYVIFTNGEELLIDNNDIKILKTKEDIFNVCNDVDFFTLINLENYYGRNYLLDMDIATRYSNVNIIGKSTYIMNEGKQLIYQNNGKENCYVDNINRDTVYINTKLFKKYGFEVVMNMIIEGKINSLITFGERIYSINKYNFIEKWNEESTEYLKYIEI